jgi:hypothetical protein
MLEIFFLIAATSAIAAFARGRGGSPWLWGSTAVGGYLLIILLTGALLRMTGRAQDPILLSIAAWSWIGLVALYTRFGLGAGRAKPGGMWICANCKYLNPHYAVMCEACGQAYGSSSHKPAEPPGK